MFHIRGYNKTTVSCDWFPTLSFGEVLLYSTVRTVYPFRNFSTNDTPVKYGRLSIFGGCNDDGTHLGTVLTLLPPQHFYFLLYPPQIHHLLDYTLGLFTVLSLSPKDKTKKYHPSSLRTIKSVCVCVLGPKPHWERFFLLLLLCYETRKLTETDKRVGGNKNQSESCFFVLHTQIKRDPKKSKNRVVHTQSKANQKKS